MRDGAVSEQGETALEALAQTATALASGGSTPEALALLVRAAAVATRADLVVARIAAPGGSELVTRVVYADSGALAAELEGSRLNAADVPATDVEIVSSADDSVLPHAVRRAAERARASIVHLHPIVVDEMPAATLELFWVSPEVAPRERALGRLAAAHLALIARLELVEHGGDGTGERPEATLELLGEALAAGADETETADQIVRFAVEATGADYAVVWRVEADAPPSLLAEHATDGRPTDLASSADAARVAVQERRVHWERRQATVPLGEPPVGALQLSFPPGAGEEQLEVLSPFLARAALALRRSRRAGLIATALTRSQTVIGVVSQAIAQLSLKHTLETAVDRIAELTASGHVGVYLREGERLIAAASRGLEGSHTELADRLLELALGPFRGRGFLLIEDMRRDPRLRGLEDVVSRTGVRRALLIPLIAHDDVIGALGVFTPRPRPYREGEEGLLIALSSQLAVAVQNARLHEQARELGAALGETLESERKTARQLRGLYAISQSFTESLSLQATLDAVAKTMVELFEVDGAAIRMPDERGDELELRAIHVANPNLRGAAPTILGRPQRVTGPLARRIRRSRRPILLDPRSVSTSETDRILQPFLAQGSTAAVLPLATPGEMLGTLTLLSLDPEHPLDRETVDAAMVVAAQAALAIDNARLYQQQKDFAETMQRSLLPRALPETPGLEVGHLYESSARVEVGGDVYDFLALDEGRLAVVLGDVTGKGIAAAADMAMAKYSFRALARKYPDPAVFLANANEVVVGEVGPGKFITMLYVLVDPASGEVACASAGHPPARIVDPAGDVSGLGSGGLALGIEPGQTYQVARVRLEPGSMIVLFTDGVVEARRGGELYGEERLDAVLGREKGVGAQALADAILADCRAFAGGGLADDCAIVCLRLAP